jgi:hypothetical protein
MERWFYLGLSALIFGGALSLPMLAGKAPFLRGMASSLEWIRWALVIHVVLCNIVWFFSVPAGLLHSFGGLKILRRFSFFCFALVVAGTVLISSAWLGDPHTHAILSNYIPVVTHPRFFSGLLLIFAGLAGAISLPGLLLPFGFGRSSIPGLEECRFGLFVGTLFFCGAVFAFLISAAASDFDFQSSDTLYFEHLMWGGGHLLQHSIAVFLMVTILVLLSLYYRSSIFCRKDLFKYFSLMGLPILVLPLLLSLPHESHGYRASFTWLMQWGIFPAFIWFILDGIRKFSRLKNIHRDQLPLDSIVGWGVLGSLFLLFMGFVFGAFIRGPDLRIPAHYHATIGSVTIAFMALSFAIVSQGKNSRVAVYGLKFYTIGQSLFALGMFIAGWNGVPRKTYGSQIVIDGFGQRIGFATLGLGGLLALVGGVLFAFSILQLINNKRKEVGI